MSQHNKKYVNSPVISILGSGWLARPLARHLRTHYSVRLSSRDPNKCARLTAEGLPTYCIDITQVSAELSHFLQADSLIIAISRQPLAVMSQLRYQLEQSPITQVLFISSTSVYQNLNREVNEDEGAEDPNNTLYQSEQLLQASPHYQTTVLRLAGLIGPQRHPGRFFTADKPVQHAQAPVNLIHRHDCVGLINAILQQQAWGEVFNGCADTHPSKQRFYHAACQQIDRPQPVFIHTEQSPFKVVSNHKAKQQLSYRYQYSDLMQLQPEDYE